MHKLSGCLCNDGLCDDCIETISAYDKMVIALRQIVLTKDGTPNRNREGDIAYAVMAELNWPYGGEVWEG